jgi:hypothetical protein
MDPGGVRWKLWAEAIRLWIPIVVSLCAISLTIFQAMHTRRHARLSVQPRIDWRIEEDAGLGTVTLSLVNVGFGPAIVTDLAFVIDGERIPATGLEACEEVSRRIGRDGEAWDMACFSNEKEYVLRAGDSVVIYGNRPAPAHAAEDHSAELVDYRRFGAEARYCSFYEDCWRLD